MDMEIKDKLEQLSCKLIFLKESAEVIKDLGFDGITGYYCIFEDIIDDLENIFSSDKGDI